MNSQNITLDLSKEDYVSQIVRIGQGDSSGTTIVASVYDNGVPVTLTGMTAKFKMRVPKVNGYVEDAHCNVSGNVITYVVDEEHCATADGYTDDAYFEIVSGNARYSTSRFRVKVLRAATQGADPAQSYSDDIVSATTAARQAANDAREAMEEIGTAVEDAAQAAESAAQAVEDAQTAIEDADTAKREATSAANAATAAANNANSSANAANTAANNANAATTATNSATQRAEAAIAAMGDISEQAVPVMSSDIRGGARIQPDSGLEITDTDNLRVRLALESDGTVRGGIAELTAKGHAEQVATTGKNLLPNNATSRTKNGVTFTVNADRSVTVNGTATDVTYFSIGTVALQAGTYTMSGCPSNGSSSTYRIYDDNRISWRDIGLRDSEATYTADSEITSRIFILIYSGATVSNLTFYPQIELGSTATEYEPYTGGAPSPSPDYPQEIQVVRGRNLFANRIDNMSINGTTGRVSVNVAGAITFVAKVSRNTDYIVSSSTGNRMVVSGVPSLSPSENEGTLIVTDNNVKTLAFNSGGNDYIAVYLGINVSIDDAQLELGSTPQPYVPYGYVGMEVRQGSTVLSTTPIPLPDRGWVGSLPDGTADSLRLDGAGKCEWEIVSGESDMSLNMTWSYSTNRMKSSTLASIIREVSDRDQVPSLLAESRRAVTWGGNLSYDRDGIAQSPVGQIAVYANDETDYPTGILLYPLATPVTEDCGYVDDWPTDIPEGATVTIPELDEVGIRYFVDSAVTELAKQWYARSNSEYEDRITALEETVADLVTGA